LSFEFFIGRRYLETKHKPSFLFLITILSIVGVAVGVMALIIVIAVMTGFESDLKKRILGVEAHAVLMHHGDDFDDYRNVIEEVKKTDGVVSASPFVYSQVMLKSPSNASGAVLRGIDFESSDDIIKKIDGDINSKAEDSRSHIPGIILGKNLAGSLGVGKNDILYLILTKGRISPSGHVPAMKRVVVTGIFESGMYDYDSSIAYMELKEAQKILSIGDIITGVAIKVKDIYKASEITKKIVLKLGFPFWATDWIHRNKNLFSALKLEKTVMFIILILIVLVAAFNIASTLIMMVMEKTKDIAILKAMGSTDKSIKKIFVLKGMMIGGIGTLIGVCSGVSLCLLLTRYKFIELPKEVYHIDTLPVQLEFFDVFLIALASMVICLLATLYPARKASKLNPVEAIRYG